MVNKIRNYLYKKKRFWAIRNWFVDNISFPIWNKYLRLSTGASEDLRSVISLSETLFEFFSYIIAAVVAVFLFHYISFLLPTKFNFNEDALHALLATVASISGVFIGLYFTALGVVAGSLFKDLSDEVRSLYLEKGVENIYIKIVIFTLLINLVYLIGQAFGYNPDPLGIFVSAVIAFYGITTFLIFGQGQFMLLDPTKLSNVPLGRLYRGIDSPTPKGFNWLNPSFQQYYRKFASRQLETTVRLVDFTKKNLELFQTQVQAMSYQVKLVIKKYLHLRKQIPTLSLWHRNKAEYPSWLLEDSMPLIMALNTGGALNPKYKREENWFEKEAIDVGLSPLTLFMEKKKWGFAQQLIEIIGVDLSEDFAIDFDSSGSKLLLEKITKEVLPLCNQGVAEDENGHIAILDSQSRIAIGFLLGFFKYIEKQSKEKLESEIAKIKWLSFSGIYKTDFPYPTISQLEYIKKGLEVESIAEGKIVSPLWYIKTLVMKKYAEDMVAYLKFLESLNEDYFLKNIQELIANGKSVLAIQLIQRWLEYLNKFQHFLPKLKERMIEYKTFHCISDLKWPEFDFDASEKKIDEFYKKAMIQMANLLPSLSAIERTNENPDYFGQAYTFTVEECYKALSTNDIDQFKAIFPKVFLACLSAYDKTRREVADWDNPESQIIYTSEPLIDLLELSSYAKIYAELYPNSELWGTCKQYWDTYLSGENAHGIIEFIVHVVEFRSKIFKIMPKAILRTNWETALRQAFQEKGLITEDDIFFRNDRRAQVNHQSLLIRVLVQHSIMLHSFIIDVFFITYLKSLSAATGVTFPQSDLSDLMERAAQNNNNEADEDDLA